MLCVGSAAAVAKEQELPPRPQARGNQRCGFKDCGAAITGNYGPKLGPLAESGFNQVDGSFAIHYRQDRTSRSPHFARLVARGLVENSRVVRLWPTSDSPTTEFDAGLDDAVGSYLVLEATGSFHVLEFLVVDLICRSLW